MNTNSNISKIEKYILSGCNEGKRKGLELEHFILTTDMEIAGYDLVSACLDEMAKKINATPYTEGGYLFGFTTEKYWISLEPGCQIEVSIVPCEKLNEIENIYYSFRKICDEVLKKHGLMLVTAGIHPLVENGMITADKLPLLPKKRYEYMDRYFEDTGTMGKYMMRATASTQVSFDFKSEEDAIRKMQLLEKLSPVLGLMTETGNDVKNRRLFKPFLVRNQIWNNVDNKRCGYFPGTLAKDYSVHDYAAYVYNAPGILLKKGQEVICLDHMSAADYYKDKELDGTEEHILSMFFPMVRLKKYLEYRIADSMPVDKALGYVALLSKIVYEEDIAETLEDLLPDVGSEEQIRKAEACIMEQGFQADVYGKNVCQWFEILFGLTMEKADNTEKTYIKKLMNLPFFNYVYAKPVYGREADHLESGKRIKEYLLSSTAKYHERVVRTLYLPKLFTEKETGKFDTLIHTLYGIFDKVIAEYEKNGEYRKLFGFPEKLEKLILRPLGYGCNVPMARIDIFNNDETGEFKFCEFNTDGTSAMNEDRELNTAFGLSDAYKEFSGKYRLKSFELFDSWVEQVITLYHRYSVNENSLPSVAIVDFLENGTLNEFEIFRQRFEKRGISTRICDIRELDFDGENCYTPDGMKIDVIYRRAVTSDIMAHYDEVQSFLDAVVAEKVCLMGDFRTQIVHNKILFKVLHLKQTMLFLTKKEQMFVKAHVPMTLSLDSITSGDRTELYEDVMNNKNHWIIKPEDSYGSKGVLAGVECTDEVWKTTVKNNMNGGYILQEFVEPYRLRNIDLLAGNTTWTTTSNLTGLFVYNGQFSGVYSRVSFEKMISTQYNEMSLPTMIVDKTLM
ncbi:MAG: glutamate-cysteine ligase family protein [Lachnospiraceae bacterium]